jgi:FlaA1/EpsC-like NDP-sugar epimerase
MVRFFMSIREAARLVIKSGSLHEGALYILDMGRPMKIVDLAREMIKFYGFTEQDVPIVFTGLRKGEKLYEEVLTAHEALGHTQYERLMVLPPQEDVLSQDEAARLLARFAESCRSMSPGAIRGLLREYVPEAQLS